MGAAAFFRGTSAVGVCRVRPVHLHYYGAVALYHARRPALYFCQPRNEACGVDCILPKKVRAHIVATLANPPKLSIREDEQASEGLSHERRILTELGTCRCLMDAVRGSGRARTGQCVTELLGTVSQNAGCTSRFRRRPAQLVPSRTGC